MRTTVTLDPDVEAMVRTAMRERGLTFKQAVNEAIRNGSRGRPPMGPVAFPTFDLGPSRLDLTKALRLAGELEDVERAADHARGR